MADAPHLVDALRPLPARPQRVLEVGAGDRFDVALAVQAAFPEADVIVTDRRAPDPPDPLLGARLVLGEDAPPDDVDVVVAVRLPPELWADARALADEAEAPLVLAPLAEESPPEAFEQVEPGVYVRACSASG